MSGTAPIDSAGIVVGDVDPLIGMTAYASFKIVRRLGSGGMGSVYLAEDPDIGQIAVKVPHPSTTTHGEAIARFIAEAKAASTIGHPHIVKFEAKATLPDGRLCLAMEYLEGRTLLAFLQSWGSLSLEDALVIVLQTGWALDAAHKRGIVHRDVKPENIFITSAIGAPTYVKLLDFGVAKHSNAAAIAGYRTQAGAVIGTPDYMAPEQRIGAPVDHRIDVYALGVVYHQMVTGRFPEVIPGTVNWRSPREYAPDRISARLASVMLWALELNPDARPRTMRQWLYALIEATDGGAALVLQHVPGFNRDADPDEKTRKQETPALSMPSSIFANATTFGHAAGQRGAPPIPSRRWFAPTMMGTVVAALGGTLLISMRASSSSGDPQAAGVDAPQLAGAAPLANAIDAATPDTSAPASIVVDAATASLPSKVALQEAAPPATSAGPIAAGPKGRLKIVAEPWGMYSIGGESAASVPARKRRGTAPGDVALPPGRYTVTISTTAARKTFDVQIKPGESELVRATFEESP